MNIFKNCITRVLSFLIDINSYNNSNTKNNNQKRLNLLKFIIYWCCLFQICDNSCGGTIVNGFENNHLQENFNNKNFNVLQPISTISKTATTTVTIKKTTLINIHKNDKQAGTTKNETKLIEDYDNNNYIETLYNINANLLLKTRSKRHSGDFQIINNSNNNHNNNYNENKDLNAKMLQRPDFYDTDDDDFDDDESYDLFLKNSGDGMYIGARCNGTCHADLSHVVCDPSTSICGCDKNHPVVIGPAKGCAKSKRLGQQCHFHESCLFNDENSLCIQIKHNAVCQCKDGFHMVSYTKPIKKSFCTRDMALVNSDMPTLLGVVAGIFVLAGLICMVLHLFSKTKYPRRPFADTNQSPTILYNSNDTGIPLTVRSGRPSSRSSFHSSDSIGSYGNRRTSSALQSGSKGILVSTSRTGSRRASLTSIHSVPSIRSYSALRFEKELQQKEIRQEMKIRLGQLQPEHKSKDSLQPSSEGGF